jgi:hypothetical protein
LPAFHRQRQREFASPNRLTCPALMPNPSLERDLHRPGTWPAKRSLSSSASRAKRHTGSGPSAQTLGLSVTPLAPLRRRSCTGSHGEHKRQCCRTTSLGHPSQPNEVQRPPSRAGANVSQFVGAGPARLATPPALAPASCAFAVREGAAVGLSQAHNAAPANRALHRPAFGQHRTRFAGAAKSAPTSPLVLLLPGRRPNCRWSGQPPASRLGREALKPYAAPRGQVAFPAAAAQLKR